MKLYRLKESAYEISNNADYCERKGLGYLFMGKEKHDGEARYSWYKSVANGRDGLFHDEDMEEVG